MATFYKFLLLWVLNLHIYIVISTLHSDDVSLSQYVRNLLPLKILFKEVAGNLGMNSDNLEFVSSSTVYDDTGGAIFLAISPSMGPTSNHIYFKNKDISNILTGAPLFWCPLLIPPVVN